MPSVVNTSDLSALDISDKHNNYPLASCALVISNGSAEQLSSSLMIHTRIRFNIFPDLGKVSECVSLTTIITFRDKNLMKTPGRILSDLSVSLGATDQRKLAKYWRTWAWFHDVWSDDVLKTELFLNHLEKVLVSFLPLDIVATLFSIYSDIKWSSDGNKWCRQFRLFLLTRFISVWIQYMHSHLH